MTMLTCTGLGPLLGTLVTCLPPPAAPRSPRASLPVCRGRGCSYREQGRGVASETGMSHTPSRKQSHLLKVAAAC